MMDEISKRFFLDSRFSTDIPDFRHVIWQALSGPQISRKRACGGGRWNVESDTFGFTIVIKSKPFTRRGILSVVSSVYDPLGFAAPFVLLAKEVFQDLCRMTVWNVGKLG